ncbi:hypothetical protein ES319_A01G062400v1 [Gossypium barbadense]|uniref:Uncharacterized protein n=1 Tax=Gossypium barbadense TaxID=3634 RepID=A0A5J5WT42_GOSBA|nr:hypothetical protein ES319_A01G062400v1 [Gossypium barbadense]
MLLGCMMISRSWCQFLLMTKAIARLFPYGEWVVLARPLLPRKYSAIVKLLVISITWLGYMFLNNSKK